MTALPIHRLALAGLLLAAPALAQDAPPLEEGASPPLAAEAPADDPAHELQRVREELREMRAEIEALRALGPPPLPPTPPPPAGPAPADARDRVAFGSPVHVRKGESVRDVASFGGPVRIEGHVYGDVSSFGGPVHLIRGGVVEGDLVSIGGSVTVEDGATLRGERVNMASPAGLGDLPSPMRDHDVRADVVPSGITSWLNTLYRKLVFLLSMAGAGVLVVGLFPGRVGRVAADIEGHPIRSLLVGGVGAIALFILSLALAITILGLPLTLLLWGVIAVAWLLGFVGLCQAVGDRLPFEQKPHGRWLAFLVGVVAVTFIGSLPFVGWFAVIGVSAIGMGAVLTSRFGAS